MREDPKIGCGISYIPGAFFPGHIFEPACKIHDHYYSLPTEARDGLSRKTIDREFLNTCLSIAKKDKKLKVTAFTWYSIIRAFGWLWW